MCIGMQESTGDFLLGYPYAQSQGLMQVSPASVLSDVRSDYIQSIYGIHFDTGTSRHYRSWYVRHGWYGNGAAHTGVSWQSIPIVRLEYQSLSTQTQSWSYDVGMVQVRQSRQ
jgi:hypothetical protein